MRFLCADCDKIYRYKGKKKDINKLKCPECKGKNIVELNKKNRVITGK